MRNRISWVFRLFSLILLIVILQVGCTKNQEFDADQTDYQSEKYWKGIAEDEAVGEPVDIDEEIIDDEALIPVMEVRLPDPEDDLSLELESEEEDTLDTGEGRIGLPESEGDFHVEPVPRDIPAHRAEMRGVREASPERVGSLPAPHITVSRQDAGFRVNWELVEGAIGYKVNIGPKPDELLSMEEIDETEYSFILPILENIAFRFYIGVKATDGEMDSPYSNIAEVTTTAPSIHETDQLTRPVIKDSRIKIDARGNLMAIGLCNGERKVYVYEMLSQEDGEFRWDYQGALQVSRERSGRDDRFGCSVAVGDGVILVGAPYRDNGRGKVFLFSKIGREWQPTSIIQLEDAEDGDRFGLSVAANSSHFLVGAPARSFYGRKRGAAYLFKLIPKRPRGYEADLEDIYGYSRVAANGAFGFDVDLDDNRNGVISAPFDDVVDEGKGIHRQAGRIFFFRYPMRTPDMREMDGIELTELDAGEQARSRGMFGYSVSLSNFDDEIRILIGAPSHITGDAGQAFLFVKKGGSSWEKLFELSPNSLEGRPDLFGYDVSLNKQFGMISSPHAPASQGLVYFYNLPPKPEYSPEIVEREDRGLHDEDVGEAADEEGEALRVLGDPSSIVEDLEMYFQNPILFGSVSPLFPLEGRFGYSVSWLNFEADDNIVSYALMGPESVKVENNPNFLVYIMDPANFPYLSGR